MEMYKGKGGAGGGGEGGAGGGGEGGKGGVEVSDCGMYTCAMSSRS